MKRLQQKGYIETYRGRVFAVAHLGHRLVPVEYRGRGADRGPYVEGQAVQRVGNARYVDGQEIEIHHLKNWDRYPVVYRLTTRGRQKALEIQRAGMHR